MHEAPKPPQGPGPSEDDQGYEITDQEVLDALQVFEEKPNFWQRFDGLTGNMTRDQKLSLGMEIVRRKGGEDEKTRTAVARNFADRCGDIKKEDLL